MRRGYWPGGGGGGGGVTSFNGRTGAVTPEEGDYQYQASTIENDSSVAGDSVAEALDFMLAAMGGAGLEAGGDLDGTYPNPSVIAATFTDGRLALGAKPTGGQLLYRDEADKITGYTLPSFSPTTRNLIAGNGLTGGGDLTADRTFNVAANADGSIVANPNDIQVGVLATDAQHGNRGGGALHSVASGGAAGFMAAADKTKLDALQLELAPAAETATGFTWNGVAVYSQRFTGTMPTSASATLASGISKLLLVLGYSTGASGKIYPAIGAVSGVNVRVDGSGNLSISNYGTDYDGNPYDLVCWYTKV